MVLLGFPKGRGQDPVQSAIGFRPSDKMRRRVRGLEDRLNFAEAAVAITEGHLRGKAQGSRAATASVGPIAFGKAMPCAAALAPALGEAFTKGEATELRRRSKFVPWSVGPFGPEVRGAPLGRCREGHRQGHQAPHPP